MKLFDQFVEQRSRKIAQASSRRGVLKRLGSFMAGAAAFPVLPVARAANADTTSADKVPSESGDPASCDYWRYCAIDGYLCDCCGGSYNACPPGTEMSPITWIGTCLNPVDGRSYVISYNDCCGKTSCGSCLCMRDEGDRPLYRVDKANDLNWCLGTESSVYHCSTAIVVGLAYEDS